MGGIVDAMHVERAGTIGGGVARWISPPLVTLLLAGCSGVELYDERDIDMGRSWGRQLAGDVKAGSFTWKEAHEICNRTVDGLKGGGEVSDSVANAAGIGCHEALDKAEGARN